MQCAAEPTVRLDLDNEPQPDAVLRILPSSGGQTTTSEDGYVDGAPELVVEVAASSASYDLHEKLRAYRRNGVLEYVVWRVLDREIDWFVLAAGRFEQQRSDDEGVLASTAFPGLRLDVEALLAGDLARVLERVGAGVRSSEHAEFVTRLGT